MKFKLTKTCVGVIDTGKERERIEKAFSDLPAVRKRLNRLMDTIEAQDWAGAHKQLRSAWWRGRSAKHGCLRLEFIGLLDIQQLGFDNQIAYDGLVMAMEGLPAGWPTYKIERID